MSGVCFGFLVFLGFCFCLGGFIRWKGMGGMCLYGWLVDGLGFVEISGGVGVGFLWMRRGGGFLISGVVWGSVIVIRVWDGVVVVVCNNNLYN